MNHPLINQNIIYNVSDVTAGVFIAGLIIVITLKRTERSRLVHLLIAAILMLFGIITHVSTRIMNLLPGGFSLRSGAPPLPAALLPLMMILSFVLVAGGIYESVNHVIFREQASMMKGVTFRLIVSCVIVASGIITYSLTKSIAAFPVAVLVQFICSILYLRLVYPGRASREFGFASIPAVIIDVITLIFNPGRLSGIGLSLMLLILYEQYCIHVSETLAEKETALAKSRVQLLADQISPHYIYNSLQSISGLCDTDPAGAKKGIDLFSEYLRGNLESLTTQDLIPFSRELEHTKAYLELEKLSRQREFEVEYRLEVTDFMLPPLVLQPIVENAIRHGASKKPGVTVITIATYEREDAIYIEVTDCSMDGASANGDGGAYMVVSEDLKSLESAKNNHKKTSIGIENVRTRLSIQSGGTLELKSMPGGTTVTIKLPYNV